MPAWIDTIAGLIALDAFLTKNPLFPPEAVKKLEPLARSTRTGALSKL